MLDFRDYIIKEAYLTERFVNLFDKNEKDKYKDEVYEMLQKAYAAIGGIKGSGFKNADDMAKNIPMWKLARKNDKIVAGVLYKDKGGRKMVATFTDGTAEGKGQLTDMMKNELSRSYMEVSEAALGFIRKIIGEDGIKKYAIPREKVKQQLKLKDDEFKTEIPAGDRNVESLPKLKDYFYQREIGGHFHTKLMIGNPNQIIKEDLENPFDNIIEFEESIANVWSIDI